MFSKEALDYRWVILSIFVGAQFVLSLAGYGWGPLAPFLKRAMGLNATQVGTIASIFYFAAALSAFPAGIAIDRYKVQKGVLFWLGLTGAPLLLSSFLYHSYAILLIMIGIAGLGYGMGNPVAIKGLIPWFDKRTRGTVLGIRQSAVTLGGAASGVVLVYISQRTGPFTALRAEALMIFFMLVIAFLFYEGREKDENIPADMEPKHGQSSKLGFKGLFFNRALLTVSMITMALGLAQGIVVTFLPLYLNESLGYSSLASGYFYTLVMLSGAVGRIFWGVVSDRLLSGSRKPVLVIISAMAIISVATLAFWARAWSQWLFTTLVIGVGLSCTGWNSLVLVLTAEISASSKIATSSGLVSTFAWCGLFLGPIGFGSLTDNCGYFWAWMFLVVFCSASLVLCFLMPVSDSNPLINGH